MLGVLVSNPDIGAGDWAGFGGGWFLIAWIFPLLEGTFLLHSVEEYDLEVIGSAVVAGVADDKGTWGVAAAA